MFLLTWTAMFLAVRVGNAEEGGGEKPCRKKFCITLHEAVRGEVGLCVFIPCVFQTPNYFTPQHVLWYKGGNGPIPIFNSDNNKGTEEGFKGRVLLLEPDVSQRNCSIMINDLTKSDSGCFSLRVEGMNKGKKDGFSYSWKTTCVSVTDLSQKPKVVIPPLTEGQQATLTCTAPGLCSGSSPKITWMWRTKEEQDLHITGNMSTLLTEELKAFSHRHTSTLTFNPSAEHHNSKLTCKASFTAGTTSQEKETLHVNYARKPQILGRTTVKEGNNLNLTCSVESFPPSNITFSGKSNSSVKNVLQEEHGIASYCITNVTREDAGLYTCTAKHMNNTLVEEINVTVTWFSGILNGSGCVLQSELICVCISEGFPLPTISWSLQNNTNYSVTDAVSGQAVSSTITLAVKSHENISVECFSGNENAEAEEQLRVLRYSPDDSTGPVPWVEILIVLSIGGFIFVFISFMAINCYRKNINKSGNLAETFEVTSPYNPQFCSGQRESRAQFQEQGAEIGTLAPELNRRSVDLTYASIDLSGFNRSLRETENLKDEETEYAEIKTVKKREDDAEEKVTEEDKES